MNRTAIAYDVRELGNRRTVLRIQSEYITYPLAVVLVMLVISSFTGHWPTSDNPYHSYTLQACAWLEGRLDLGMDYPWLELAIYDGKYYVSFPPFPSFVMLPFAAVFGVNTPDHLISMAFTVLGVVYALKLYEVITGSLKRAEQYVLFLFLGNGYLFISVQGWVWYLAQCMCFTLSLMAVYYAVTGRGGNALTLWACAVGCRPMVAVYFPLLVWLLRKDWKWRCTLPMVLIAVVYMLLNWARFGNPLEFGHNYLPEFVQAENGQFSWTYLLPHLQQLFRLPKAGGANGALIYDTYDCMAFWLIAPMSLSFLGVWLHAVWYRFTARCFEVMALPAMLLAHLLIVCCHRTLGGFQFGNRYLVDLLPFLFYGLLSWKPKGARGMSMNIPLFMLGFSINLIGAVAAYNHWI